jgi:hypothetical protein
VVPPELGAGAAGAGTVAAGAAGWLGAGVVGWAWFWVEGADWLGDGDGDEAAGGDAACGADPGGWSPSWLGVASGGIFRALTPAWAVRLADPADEWRALDLAPSVWPWAAELAAAAIATLRTPAPAIVRPRTRPMRANAASRSRCAAVRSILGRG